MEPNLHKNSVTRVERYDGRDLGSRPHIAVLGSCKLGTPTLAVVGNESERVQSDSGNRVALSLNELSVLQAERFVVTIAFEMMAASPTNISACKELMQTKSLAGWRKD